MTAERSKLEAAQRDLDAKRAQRKAAKDADQAAADTKAKVEIARRLGRIREAAAADPDRSRKIAESDARNEAKRARQDATAPVADRNPVDAMRAALRNPHPADAIARTAFAGKHQAKCWADVVEWWHRDVSQELSRAAREALASVLGKGAEWWPWPPSEVDATNPTPSDMRAGAPGCNFDETLDVVAVVLLWLDLPEPRPTFPLAPLVDAWKRQPDPPDKARVSVVEGTTRLPYATSEVLRRSWRRTDEVTAVYVDGEPLTARLVDARPKHAQRWLYTDDPAIAPEPDGNLLLPDRSFRSIYPQNARDMPLPMVALGTLGHMDRRKSLPSDLRTVLTVAYATTRPVVWTDEEGARLLARSRDGGFRDPTVSDVRRWRDAVQMADSIYLYYLDKYGRAWVRLIVADPYGDGRISISPPAWFRERVSDSATVGANMGWTLTGAAHPARQRGTTTAGTAYAHVIASMEYWLGRSYEGKPGIAPLLQPVRPGGPGPWVSMRWHEVLQWLAMERWDRSQHSPERAARNRFWRLVYRLQDVGYMTNRRRNSDVVECEASDRMRGAATPWLRFRATASFCEAARLAQTGKWQSAGLLEWYGLSSA